MADGRKRSRKAVDDTDSAQSVIEGLRALVKFLPELEQPDFRPGEMKGPQEIEPGVMTFPYATLSDTAESFVQAAYHHELVLTGFDWPKWCRTAAAKRLRDDEAALARATPEQLARLLTVCIRQDRFVEGSLLQDFETGLMLRIVRRAAALVADAK